jgi:glutathione synthase
MNTKPKLGVVMDPIESIQLKKDSTFAMLIEAERRGYSIYYMEQKDLFYKDGKAFGNMSVLHVKEDKDRWFERLEASPQPLSDLDLILMRKDPPFDMEYVYSTYILELAERDGVLVINKPQTLRDANEKFFTAWFPQCCPPTLVARSAVRLREFLFEHHDIIVKPLDGMGGASIFRITQDDHNLNVILETLTHRETRFIMAQRYIPEIKQGDKRILLINGVPIDYALARIPKEGESRGNLAAGGRGVGIELSQRDHWICQEIAPVLRAKGLLFVGIDVIGDYLTEINITSPTCIRELDAIYGLNISGKFFNCIEEKLSLNSSPPRG